ncbi:MAG: sulfite exporter TauE/SafE family protein [Pseudomonadota bacterium]
MPLDPTLLVLCAGFMIIGGMVKGVTGIGLPAFLVGTLSMFIAPREVVGVILLPIMLTNIRQAFIGEPVLTVLWRYRYLAIVACAMIFVTASLAQYVPQSVLLILVGSSVALFGITSLIGTMPRLPDSFDVPGQGITGFLSGLLGGLTAIWGPPIVAYLMARGVEKEEFVQVTGLMFSVSSLWMAVGMFFAQELSWPQLGLSASMVPLAFGGIFIGEWIRARLDRETFFKVVLVAFFLIGLNLIRKGVVG